MNYKLVSYMVGRILQIEGVLMVLPLVVSLVYSENCWQSFLVSVLLSIGIGILLTSVFGKKEGMVYAKDGFAIVALAWIVMSLAGALPFYLSGEITSFVDAFFETVSGFTTTGASILANVEGMSRGLLFWRSFTHWIGGMGVLVFVMAIFPQESGRSMNIMKAEMPGPIIGKLVPRVRETAKILYLIYIVMSVLEIILLGIGGMPFFDCVVHTFGTAGTGGFGIKADSMVGYSAYSQWVIAIFMMLFGINFNIYYLILVKRFRTAFKSTELWWYVFIMIGAALFVGIDIYPIYQNVADSAREAFFQVSSIMTTTGFASADFNLWPTFSKMVLIVLMFIGACAGSTGGGIKVSRVIIAIKSIHRDIKKMIHPRAIASVKFEGKSLDNSTVNGISVYFVVYFIVFFVLLLLISLNGFDFETTFSATTACYNNIGPGLAGAGPMSNYADFSVFSKIILSFAMLLGRLEIFPMLLIFAPFMWKKK